MTRDDAMKIYLLCRITSLEKRESNRKNYFEMASNKKKIKIK